jgi:sulfur carrier protein ThiS
MKIIVIDERNNIEKELEVNNIKEAAEKLNINLEEVITTKNNELVTEDSKLKDKDELKFLSVISGG